MLPPATSSRMFTSGEPTLEIASSALPEGHRSVALDFFLLRVNQNTITLDAATSPNTDQKNGIDSSLNRSLEFKSYAL